MNNPATGAQKAPATQVRKLPDDASDAIYDERSTGASCDYDMEQPTQPVTSTDDVTGAVQPSDVYLDVMRNSAAQAYGNSADVTPSNDDASLTRDVTTPDEEESIYFKDNDAYER